ncbi:MAG: hypothetical protein SF029_25595 [bacterium]|nr:hypothetical protein [bacterium]
MIAVLRFSLPFLIAILLMAVLSMSVLAADAAAEAAAEAEVRLYASDTTAMMFWSDHISLQ